MPVYKLKIDGIDPPRVVKAESAAQARNHVVEAIPLTAEALADLIAAGAKVETAGKSPAE